MVDTDKDKDTPTAPAIEGGRKCMRCGKQITKSDGGVLARDLIAFHEGRIKGSEIRETCGLCVLRPDAVQYLEQIS